MDESSELWTKVKQLELSSSPYDFEEAKGGEKNMHFLVLFECIVKLIILSPSICGLCEVNKFNYPL